LFAIQVLRLVSFFFVISADAYMDVGKAREQDVVALPESRASIYWRGTTIW